MHRTALVLSLLMLLAFSAGAGESLSIDYYYTPGCPMCKATTAKVDEVSQTLGVCVNRYNMKSGPAVAQELFKRLTEAGIEETPSLSVFIFGRCLAGGEKIIADLEQTILAAQAGTLKPPTVLEQDVDRTGFWVVSAAALADGVNPCAFATVILFVSMLGSVGRNRKDILITGFFFTLAVYLSYLLIGLLVFEVFKRMQPYHIFASIVQWIAIAAAGIFGIMSLVDGLVILRTKKPDASFLQLPTGIKNRIRKVMRSGAHTRHLYVGAFVVGIMISFLESICTGQVYFPVIAGLVKGDHALRGVLMLIHYCALFVLPLIAVFFLVFFGVTSEKIAAVTRHNAVAAKLLLGGVFFSIAVWLGKGMLVF